MSESYNNDVRRTKEEEISQDSPKSIDTHWNNSHKLNLLLFLTKVTKVLKNGGEYYISKENIMFLANPQCTLMIALNDLPYYKDIINKLNDYF